MSTKQKEESLPLMDELNELIEKERTLLNLKLLAQKNETETWKTKYDKLIDKVGSGTGTVNVDLTTEQQLEAAAEIDSEFVEHNASYADIQKILIERTSSWALDLSKTKMNLLDFAKLCKEVFGSRSSFESINLIDLHNCELTDEYTTTLLSFIRSSRLQAIDLSCNQLSEIFFLQFLTTLKDRRSTPQYILLSNNVPLSTTAKHFAAILETLTEHTWGLTVSLQDFTDIVLSAQSLKSSKRSTMRKELNYDYKETIKQPNFAYEFLRAYNTKLDPSGKGLEGSADKSTTTAALKKAAAAGRGAVVLGRQKGLHKLAAFGLTHSKLNTRSITLLETTLLHTAPTLTDLDLSFAYIGYPGAEVIRRVLSSPGCQLVRLALIGNALGDAGVTTVSKSLRAHPTLTYLDVRSNSVSDLGLNAFTRPLVCNQVLSVLDLRGNCFSQETLLALKTSLYNVGSQIHLRCTDATSIAEVKMSPREALEQNTVFSAPYKMKVVGVVGSPTKLFSIDLAVIEQNHPEQWDSPMCLHWQWRPVPVGTHSTAGVLLSLPSAVDNRAEVKQNATSRSSRKSHSSAVSSTAAMTDNAAFFQIGSDYAAHWEVRIVHSHQELFCQHEAVAATSCVTRSLLQRDPHWTDCSLLLPKLHAKATLEVYVHCAEAKTDSLRGISSETTTSRSKAVNKFIAFEGMSFQLKTIQTSSTYPAGRDSVELGVTGNALFAQYGVNMIGLQELYPEMNGLKLLRRFCWTQTTADAVILAWEAKLSSSLTAEKATAADGTSHTEGNFTPSHRSLGYTWIIFVYSADGGVRRAAEGICTAITLDDINSEKNSSSDGVGSSSSGNAKLRAWQWNHCSANITNLQVGDTLLLAARIHSERPNHPAASLQSCSVAVRDCTLSVLVNTSLSQSDPYEGQDEIIAGRSEIPAGVMWDLDSASLLAVHDDVHVYFPM